MSATPDPLLAMIPFEDPVPTRRVSLVWRKSFSRRAAVDCLGDVVHSVELPGCRKIEPARRPVSAVA